MVNKSTTVIKHNGVCKINVHINGTNLRHMWSLFTRLNVVYIVAKP